MVVKAFASIRTIANHFAHEARLSRQCLIRLQSFFLCVLLVQWATVSPPATASPIAPQVPTSPQPPSHSTSPTGAQSSLNLNLSSTTASMSAPNGVGHLGLTINIGHSTLTVVPGQQLTPAEMMAVYQVMHGGTQNIVLSANGAAIGGTVSIGQHLSNSLGSLTIPQGVSVISNSSSLKVSGNVVDSGNLFLTSTSPGVQAVSLVANTVTVSPNALISTILPSVNPLSSIAPATMGLSITAQSNIVNAGTISSGGVLNITAGGTITNAAAIASAHSAVMQAAGAISIVSGSGIVTNAGLISSANGSINISTINPATDININGAGGVFTAATNINLRNPSYTGSNNINLNGGDYLSQNLNLYSGSGTITGGIGNVSGNISSVAQIEHFSANANVLTLSDNTVTGDPTFVNTGGNIVINGINTFNGNLAILASGDITADSTGAIVDHGKDVTLVAGAGLSTSGGGANTSSTTVSSGTGSSLLGSGTVTVNLSTAASGVTPGGTGGNIDLSASSAPVVIDTTATAANSPGGSVTLAAFANGTNGGNVLVNASNSNVGAINTYATGTASAGGSVNVYAGANPTTSATSIQLSSISTGGAGVGGVGSKGTINIYTAEPTANAGTTVTFDNTGTIGSGQSIVNAATLSPNAGVAVANLISAGAGGNGANITIMAPSLANNGSIQTSGSGSISVQSTGDLALSGTGSFTTGSSGSTTFQAASSGSSTLTVASGTALAVGGGGAIYITTPNLNFAGTSQIAASGSSNITIGSGTSGTDVPLDVTAQSGRTATLATNGGLILVRPTGAGTASFLSSGIGATTIQLNAAGTSGNGVVDLQSFGDFSIAAGVTLSSNSPIQVNLNNDKTLTLNGTLSTTAGNANFPDPLGGYMQYSILVQNLITNFTVAGNGSFVQAGTTRGYTVFNDFTDVGFADGSSIRFTSSVPGSYVNFYTRQIQVNGTGLSANASLSFSNVAAVNFNTNLPSFGPGDVAFIPGGTALTGTLNLTGAPVNIGFPGVAPPVSIPTLQQPVANIDIGTAVRTFNLLADQSVSMHATNSINVLQGDVQSSAGNIAMTVPTVLNAGLIEARSGIVGFNGGNGGTLSVVNNGTINALGTGGIVGFNAGLFGAITLTGSGSIQAGQVNLGNVDTSTWLIIPPATTVSSPFSGSIQVGNVTLAQTLISGPIQVASSVPSPSPTPSSTQGILDSTLNPSSVAGGISQFNNVEAIIYGASQSSAGATGLTILPTDSTRVSPLSATNLTAPTAFPLSGKISETVDGGSRVSIYLGSSFLSGTAMSNGNLLQVTEGMSLFAPDSDVTVQTNAGEVNVSAGAVVFIAATGSAVAIYDMSDEHNGDVSVVLGGQQLNLMPGEQIMIRQGQAETDTVEHLLSGIGQRMTTKTGLANGSSATVSEFSILGILNTNSLYRTLHQSSNPANRRVLGKILKVAAAIQVATAGHGRYQQAQSEQ